MSLIKCTECGNEVSTQAKTCPKCGAKVKKLMSRLTKILLGGLGISILIVIATGQPATNGIQETPQEKAAKAEENKRYSAAAGATKTLRDSMRDPDSLKFESVRVNDDASVICAEYRARNGFGGMNREHIVVTTTRTSQSAADWNKHCIKPMHDMLWAAK